MMHQYRPPRFRLPADAHGHRVGTIPVGTIVYIQDGIRPLSGFRTEPVCRNPWIVESWHNREYFPCVSGAPYRTYMHGGHLATVRSLRDGRRAQVADWILAMCVDAGLERIA